MPTPRRHATNGRRQSAYRQRQKLARLRELNAKGLPGGAPIPSMPSAVRWNALLDQAESLLQTLADEMSSYWDDRSEAWQESDRGEEMQQKIATAEEVLDALREVR